MEVIEPEKMILIKLILEVKSLLGIYDGTA